MRLILASASPRRRELLAQAGYTFTVEAADIDETQRPGEDAAMYVRRLAEEKAGAIHARHSADDPTDATAQPLIVLGADTCVVCDHPPGGARREEILGKPRDSADARRMLQMLSGRNHCVLTGIAVASRAGAFSHVESTEVTFARIPERELDLYCATAEPLDKAGAYGIQGYAARWIPRIHGCYFNVMGLPIARTVGLIEEAAAAAVSKTART